ncbi:hypothetical protein EYZ11_003779 [Aspergillus tanneri]|uniref:Amino acid permease/ SLC12A domain-containing protein n=1 Tax=Aspergillus tanneri TaxID=1220188 RepID=A0A4S3JT18_9EURO|nr:hypothetical protein EYZ11_003779 [Aspergillus tanneri]
MQVDSRAIPFYSITAIAVAALMLSLLILWSGAILDAVVSLTVSALFSSYLMATGLLLYHRLTRGIQSHEDGSFIVNTTGAPLTWGPFHIPRKWGIATNTITPTRKCILIQLGYRTNWGYNCVWYHILPYLRER